MNGADATCKYSYYNKKLGTYESGTNLLLQFIKQAPEEFVVGVIKHVDIDFNVNLERIIEQVNFRQLVKGDSYLHLALRE
jgi:hypothetical protein